MKKIIIVFLGFSLIFASCKEEVKPPTEPISVKPLLATSPVFSGENAYNLVAKQVAFGPRHPNSVGHTAMGNWLIDTLIIYADTIYILNIDLKNAQQT